MGRCGETWVAPVIHASGAPVAVQQFCVLERGHAGEHCSWSKVTYRGCRFPADGEGVDVGA